MNSVITHHKAMDIKTQKLCNASLLPSIPFGTPVRAVHAALPVSPVTDTLDPVAPITPGETSVKLCVVTVRNGKLHIAVVDPLTYIVA